MSESGMGDMVRKIVSLILLVAAGIALVGFFIGSGTLVFDPIINAFDPFNFEKLGLALFGFVQALSVPLILVMLGLIGLTVDH